MNMRGISGLVAILGMGLVIVLLTFSGMRSRRAQGEAAAVPRSLPEADAAQPQAPPQEPQERAAVDDVDVEAPPPAEDALAACEVERERLARELGEIREGLRRLDRMPRVHDLVPDADALSAGDLAHVERALEDYPIPLVAGEAAWIAAHYQEWNTDPEASLDSHVVAYLGPERVLRDLNPALRWRLLDVLGDDQFIDLFGRERYVRYFGKR